MIKKFDISDIERVMQIWLETNIAAHFFIEKSFWTAHHQLVKELIPTSEIFIFETDHLIKGFIGISGNDYITGLFVSSEYQKHGIGSQLLKECQKCYPALTLHVYAKNIQAIHFYESYGFHPIEEKENPQTNELELTMQWRK